MARIPDRAEHQRRFAALDLRQRREVVRAVNRGRVLEDRRLAALAVGLAQRQQRFWRWAWLMGPAIGLVQLFFVPATAALINAGIGTVTLGLVSWWWYSRARKAEVGNRQVAEGTRQESGHRRRRQAGHLPGAEPPEHPRQPVEETTHEHQPVVPGRRPYRPRRRKRR